MEQIKGRIPGFCVCLLIWVPPLVGRECGNNYSMPDVQMAGSLEVFYEGSGVLNC
jgi:hypothetical protein